MGNKTSKKSKEMRNKTSKKSKETSAMTYTTELGSYEVACKEDTEIQAFDTRMQERTSHVISTLSTGGKVRALSFDSLKVVTENLLDMNQDVVKVILDCKKDIWKNQEMFELVQDYFETSLKMLDFCDALERALQRLRSSHPLILGALQQFEKESRVQGGNGYKKTLEKLKNLIKDAQSPFDEDFFKMFHSVYKQQMLMLEKLQLRKNKLDKELKHIHTWRKLSNIIFVTTYATVLICSVVAAAMAAPPVAAALAAAIAAPLGSIGKCIVSLWKHYENALKGQKKVISSMQAGTYVAVEDLDKIRDLIQQLDTEIKKIVKSAEYAVEHSAEYAVEHGAVKIGINEIKNKLEEFRNNVDKLGIQADLFGRDIRRARTAILKRIIKHPSNGSSST